MADLFKDCFYLYGWAKFVIVPTIFGEPQQPDLRLEVREDVELEAECVPVDPVFAVTVPHVCLLVGLERCRCVFTGTHLLDTEADHQEDAQPLVHEESETDDEKRNVRQR